MSGVRDSLGRLPLRRHGVLGAIIALSVLVAVSVAAPAGAAERGAQTAKQTRALWTGVAGTPRPARTGARPAIRPDRFRSFRLDRVGLRSALAGAGSGLVVSLPAPGGGFQRFALELSPVMEPGARSQAPEHQDVRRARPRRPDGDHPGRHRPARVPRLGALAEGLVVHRPLLPQRPERVRQLLRPRPRRRARRLRRARGRRGRSRGVRGGARRDARRPRGAARHPADLSPRAPQRPDLRDLLRRPRQRDGRQGHARQPRQPDLRGRDGRPHDPHRQQRPDQPRHARADDGRERAVRLLAVLHAGAGDLVRWGDPDPHAHRHRAADRRVELRRRPHRPRQPRRRRGEPRRRGREQQGAGVHRALDSGRRLLRRRLRRARDRAPVRRQPHLQRNAVQLLRRQPQRGQLGRAGQRLVDHGLRRHLPAGQSPAAQRPVLVVPQLPGDHGPGHRRQAADQRGAERLADRLLRRQRDADVPAHRLRRHRLVPARSTSGTCRRRS